MTQVPLTGVQTQGHEAPPSWQHIPGDFRSLTPRELERLSKKGRAADCVHRVLKLELGTSHSHSLPIAGGKQYAAGYTCTTLMCEGRAYLPYLTQKLHQLDVQIKRQFVRSLEVHHF